MANDNPNAREHVDELLSGYIDGELTQQDRQRVELLCEESETVRKDLEELRALRERIRRTPLGELDAEAWGERMNDTGVRASALVGWILFIGGLLLAAGVFVVGLLFDSDLGILGKLIVVGVYGGLAGLLISVLRQRLIERKTDKYKNVRI